MDLADHRPTDMFDASFDSTGGPDTDATGASQPVTPDDAFSALADPRRRAVLSSLRERPGETVAVETLADTVSQRTRESDSTRRVAASLSTVHLPKLDDWNLIEYDRERRTVRYTDSALVNGLLARLDESE